MDKFWVYTCKACGQVFNVPPDQNPVDHLGPEVMKVILHEEQHNERGEKPGWKVKNISG